MKEYINVKELQELTGLGYQQSMRIIVRVQEKMKKKGYYIPQSRARLALRWMIWKELGLNERK